VKVHQELLKERAKIHDALGKKIPDAHVTVRKKA
tara:strand:+ start:268 stop:369 length:102 start_codon:yes stop_codon:yes gene_type:complete